MSSIQRSVAKVRQRVLINRVFAGLGWAVFGTLAASTAMLAADKLMPLTEVPTRRTRRCS